MIVMKNCFLLCVIGLIIACIICCRVNVTLDMILGGEDILISWFVVILALLGVASLFVCCMIHCKHLRLSDANKLSYLLSYCCDSRSYCMQHHDRLKQLLRDFYFNAKFIVIAASRPVNRPKMLVQALL